MRHKFNAKPTTFNDQRYSSKLEAKYAQRLNTAKEKGELVFWLEQVPFLLPGSLRYKIDFMEFWAPKDGQEIGDIICTEVKGMETKDWIMRKKLFESTYPIPLNIVKK